MNSNLISNIYKNYDSYIVIGDNEYIINIFNMFKNLEKHVEYFLTDNLNEEKQILGKPQINYKYLSNLCIDEYKFIIFQPENFDKISEILIKKYKVKKENILHGSKWLIMILKKYKDVLIFPKKYRFEFCSICQLKCYGCYMRNNEDLAFKGVGKGYLKFEVFKSIIEKYPFIKEIEISDNGEPFLNPDMAKIIKYSAEHNIILTCINGTNFNDVSDEVLECMVKYNNFHIMNLSIDGATNETYIKYRAGGNFDKVIENVKKLNEYKKKYNSEFPTIIWKYILMDHNEHEVEKAIDLAKQLGIQIWFCVDYRGFHPKDPEKIKKLTGIDNEVKFGDELCRHMIESPQINWDGKLLGCCITYKMDWKRNIFEDGLIESLNTDYYRHAVCKLLGDTTDYHEHNQCTDDCYTYLQYVSKGEHIEY